MNLPIEIVSGRIGFIGVGVHDQDLHTYQSIEVETGQQRVVFKPVMASTALSRALTPGKHVALAITRFPGKKGKVFIWAAADIAAGRIYAEEELFKMRSGAIKQALLMSGWFPIFFIVGLILCVIPGLILAWLLWKLWANALSIPTVDEVRHAIDALGSHVSPIATSLPVG